MKFQKKLKIYCQGILVAWRDSFKNGPVKQDEPLARFIFDPKHFDKNSKAKPAAFTPRKAGSDLSVFRVENASEQMVEFFGNRYVAMLRNKPLIGWATFSSSVPKRLNLHLNPDGTPYRRHLNIEKWPSTYTMERVELANNCNSHVVSKEI
jgi:hypothetical protein